MASTFTATSSIGSMVAPNGHKSDKKLTNKLSSSSFGRRQNVCPPRPRRTGSAIVCAAKELHFNKDGTTIRRLQVSICFLIMENPFPNFTAGAKGFVFSLVSNSVLY